eukprot:31231-Pelagococcus_subviridis.AAC.3
MERPSVLRSRPPRRVRGERRAMRGDRGDDPRGVDELRRGARGAVRRAARRQRLRGGIDAVRGQVAAGVDARVGLGRVSLALVPIRPRSRGERRFLRTFSPGGRISPPAPRFRSRHTYATPFDSQV